MCSLHGVLLWQKGIFHGSDPADTSDADGADGSLYTAYAYKSSRYFRKSADDNCYHILLFQQQAYREIPEGIAESGGHRPADGTS